MSLAYPVLQNSSLVPAPAADVAAYLVPLLALGLLVVGIVGVVILRAIAAQLRDLRSRLQPLEELAHLGRLDELREELRAYASTGGSRSEEPPGSDRVEALLEAIGEETRRSAALLEEVALALQNEPVVAIPAPAPQRLGERVVNRLLSMGFERIQVVTDSDFIEEIAAGDGEVLIEAYRQGVLHKGRLLVRGGELSDVDVHPTYSIFP